MPEIKFDAIVTKEEKEKDEAERKKKRLGREEVTKAPEIRYDKSAVSAIVDRMKTKYEDRGFDEKKETGKTIAFKKMVSGHAALALDQRQPEELATHKGFPGITGRIFSRMPFLKRFSSGIMNMSTAKNMVFDLDSANWYYSASQYAAIAFLASFLAALFTSLFCLVLLFTAFAPTVMTSIVVPFFGGGMVFQILTNLIITMFVFFFSYIVAVLISLQWPKSVALQRGKAIDKDLSFALRHMATEIRAGIGIHQTMKSIVEADYGTLSQEFARSLQDIEKGVPTEDALDAMAQRSPSDALATATRHMIRALRTGGNLSDVVEMIADDTAFEIRMKMKDFVERLNIIGLFYMMVGIVLPVFIAVLAGIFNAIPTIGMAGMLGVEVLFLIYFLLIPLALSLILYVIKVMQPM